MVVDRTYEHTICWTGGGIRLMTVRGLKVGRRAGGGVIRLRMTVCLAHSTYLLL